MKLPSLQFFISYPSPAYQAAAYLYSLLEIPLPIFGPCDHVHVPTNLN